jgi:hypothetical protein
MAAMRLFEPQDLEDALEKLNCTKTEINTDTATYWRTKNNTLFSVPEPDELSGMHSDLVYFRLVSFAQEHKDVK